MMAFTSSELTMLSILPQNTPEAVGSVMVLKPSVAHHMLNKYNVKQKTHTCI